MCSGSAPAPAPPPPPPAPPPPVLEQSAPVTAAPNQAELQNRSATGTKKYRNRGMDIPSVSTTAAGGLGIPSN